MEVPWSGARRIVCLGPGPLTEEHIIPQQVGGKLWARFLCKPCNDRLGDEVEAEIKNDPALQHAVRTLAPQIPALARRILESQLHIGRGPGGVVPGRIKNGKFSVDASRRADGSVIQPTPDARKHIARVLQKYSPAASNIAEALKRFDEAPDNRRIDITPGVAVRWKLDSVDPALDGPSISEIVLLKIAYEFLACHLGELVYDEAAPLRNIRGILTGSEPPQADVFTVEPLTTREYAPVHGVALVGDRPHAVIKVCLFGWLLFRIDLHQVAVAPPHYKYTHALDDGTEEIEPINATGSGS
jgi:hypothetical protein